LFPSIPLVACWRYEPREHRRPLAMSRATIPPSPLSDRPVTQPIRSSASRPIDNCPGGTFLHR
jgi:hypothetical protein